MLFGIFIEKITIYYENPVYCTVTLLFCFSEYLSRKLRFITKIPSIVQLPYTSPPNHFGPPIWVGSVREYTFFTCLRILKKSENQGRSLPSRGGSSTRSPLIFWVTFPTYPRMLFQQKTFFAIFDLNLR